MTAESADRSPHLTRLSLPASDQHLSPADIGRTNSTHGTVQDGTSAFGEVLQNAQVDGLAGAPASMVPALKIVSIRGDYCDEHG